MEFERNNQFSDDSFDESTNIRSLVEKYLTHIKWFFISLLIFILLAFLFIRYSIPQYNANASILIKEKEKGSSFDNFSSFEDLGLFNMGNNDLENEVQILKSRRLMTQVVEELKLNIQYSFQESPYDKEIYPNFPFMLHIDSSSIEYLNSYFRVVIKSKTEFELIQFNDKTLGTHVYEEKIDINLGNDEVSDYQKISMHLTKDLHKELIGKTVIVKIYPISSIVDVYMDKMGIEPVNEKQSNVLSLSLNENIVEKGMAIVNNLIEQYNADGIKDINDVAQTTTNFLDDRLILIEKELGVIETTAAQFKTNKGMINANTEANYYLQSSTVTEGEMVNANTQMQLVNYMLDELNNTNLKDLLPGNIGLSDISLVGMISEYNNLVLQRNRVLKSSSVKNPIIVNIDSQLQILKNNLESSLNNLKSSAKIQIDALNKKQGNISSKIASAPKYEKDFKNIIRQQETKNALYLFLLQKREESILSNAVQVNKAKIIDTAYSSGIPISPKKKLIYLASIFLGIILPIVIIYLKDLLDTKVHDENDIKRLKIPYLGDVPLALTKKNLYINDGDNSSIAEAFRYIRTNINFMLDSKDKGKVVFVTSTQSGEGKTFTAINLASSLAVSGKKTLLLAMDLRAPRISKYLGLEDNLGVTNFIKNKELTIDDIIDKYTRVENLDIMNSGDIPPNPVELLMSKRVYEIFEEVKDRYEYIIVDTAPVGMVTDTIQISNYADMTIYIVKANYLDKRMLHIPQKLHKENKLPNMAILINGSDHSNGAYGYGYGYGYGNKKTPWYKIK